MSPHILEMRSISKIFPGVKALDNAVSKSPKARFTVSSVKMGLESRL